MERNSIKYTQKNAILNYFQPQNTSSEAKEIASSILNNDLVTDSPDIAFDFVNELLKHSFESAQKPTAHTGSRVNNIKEQTTPSPKTCQEQRDTLKF